MMPDQDVGSSVSLPFIMRRLVGHLDKANQGKLLIEAGEQHSYQVTGEKTGEVADLRLNDSAAIAKALLVAGEIGFARSYLQGHWDTTDLTRLFCWFADNETALKPSAGLGLPGRLMQRFQHWGARNSLRGSRRNIAAHYDLGNDFYRLWLDSSMTYSSGIFTPDDHDLERAQTRKYARLLASLDASPGDHILEIGCGWGGFAEYAARQGYRVTGITLSREQLAFAQARIERVGLADLVSFELRDYRKLDGTWDHIVSIEMFEAVGEAWWPSYFNVVKRCLRTGGRAALQIITIDEARFEQYRRNPDFIQLFVFPGGMLPTVSHLHALAAGQGLKVARSDQYGHDYARTLSLWHQRFNAVQDDVVAQGFDPYFIRLWRYYLAYCEAGFLKGTVDLVQLRLDG